MREVKVVGIHFPDEDVYISELDRIAGQPWVRTSRLGSPFELTRTKNPRGY